MARKPRVEFPGAFYHIIARGNNRQEIFHDRDDRTYYLTQLKKYQERFKVEIYAFVLMPNHFHLLLETEDTPLSRVMQCLQTSYTQYFNRKYNRVGHLFQGRYQAILCERDVYLLELVRYIHLNPVRANMVKDPADYPWSSYRIYLGKEKAEFINTSLVLEMMGAKPKEVRKVYERFVLEALRTGHRKDFYQTVDQRYLGSDEFIEKVKKKIDEGELIKKHLLRQVSFDDLIDSVSRTLSVPREEIVGTGQGRKTSLARSLCAYVGNKYIGLTGQVLAGYLHRDPSSITKATKRIEKYVYEDEKIRKDLNKIISELK